MTTRRHRHVEAARFCPFVDQFDHTAVWPAGVPFPVEIKDGEARFNFETRGPWSIISRLEALAVSKAANGVTVYGVRSLLHPRESGYQHEGRVNVGGKNYRAFTSSQLFLVEGKLVSVATLYVVKK